MFKRLSPIVVVICGTVVSALLVGAVLVFMNPPQCPSNTPAAGNNCIIGANIGAGLYWLLAIGLWLASIVSAVVLYIVRTLSDKNTNKTLLATKCLLVVVLAIVVATLVVPILLGMLSAQIKQ